MTTAENLLLIAASLLVLIIIGNIGFSKLASWRLGQLHCRAYHFLGRLAGSPP